jgi:DNA-binding CsgD family transcriptional regulator
VAAAGGEFVRAAEWGKVRDFAAGVRARAEPAVLAMEGEAGAGKSTLWRAGLTGAAEAGCTLLRSEPSASEADASFAGLSDLLTGVLPTVAATIPGPQREALEVALLLRPADQQPPTAHVVGLAVLAALRSCLQNGPVLVAIDDAQWLDAGSLDALAFALRRITTGPLSVMLAARTEAPADPLTAGVPPLPQRWRELLAAWPGSDEVVLAPLDGWQVQSLLPSSATAAQARLVARQSRGNPFWAREVWASLDSDEAPIPPRARALTERMSRMLSPPALEAITTVAAAGRIGLPDALTVLGHLADPAGALDAAVVTGLVVETEGRVMPAHPLIGAAALEALPPARRAQLYWRLAAVASSPERHAHFAALAAAPGPDSVVADSLDAAAAAAHARAANAAAAQFAVQAVTFTPASDPEALVRRRIRAGELLFVAGEVARSLEHLELLDTGSLPTPELERALPVLVDMVEMVRGPDAATGVVTRAVETAGTDPRRRALMLSLASNITYGIRHRRRPAAEDAIGCAEVAGPAAAPTLHRALLNLLVAKMTGGEGLDQDLLRRAEQLEPAIPAAIPLQDTADLHRGLWSRFVEDLESARAALRRSIAQARETGEDWALCTFLSYLAAAEELAGDFAAAGVAVTEAGQVAAWHDWPISPWHVEPRCELLIAAGQLEQARQLADEQLPDDEQHSVVVQFVGASVRGKVSAWRGDTPAAIRQLERAAWCADQREWADPAVRSRVDPLLAEQYLVAGRTQEAGRIAGWLREIGLRLDRPALIGDACRIDALAAAVTGDLDAAAESGRAAVAAHERTALRPELARSLLALGRIERRRKARSQARAALQRAMTLAAEMRHQPLLAQTEQELPRTAAARAGGELTEAERRVAGEIVAGATNREVAAALFISVRTVETHVAAIRRKLGVSSRPDLRRALSRI